MLYRLNRSDDVFDKLEPVAFKDFSSYGNLEKDLEDLIAKNILETLYEDASLMPISQERPYQAEADIYALNERGDLVIFELKRGGAGEEAVHQALRYAQDAGQWSYSVLQEKYRQYAESDAELNKAHQEAFNLERPLDPGDLNKRQHLVIIGSAADDRLIDAVDYWKRQGVLLDFLPYRVYEIAGQTYFEFFALPYDRHSNPGNAKGVIFDTNRSWDEDSIWFMMENACVAAFGEARRFIEYLQPGDIVFYSHRWVGIVTAARVKKGGIKAPDEETLSRDVEFLTPIPRRGEPMAAMPFSEVSEITGKTFFWARTIKVPYLTKEEAEILVEALKKILEA